MKIFNALRSQLTRTSIRVKSLYSVASCVISYPKVIVECDFLIPVVFIYGYADFSINILTE